LPSSPTKTIPTGDWLCHRRLLGYSEAVAVHADRTSIAATIHAGPHRVNDRAKIDALGRSGPPITIARDADGAVLTTAVHARSGWVHDRTGPLTLEAAFLHRSTIAGTSSRTDHDQDQEKSEADSLHDLSSLCRIVTAGTPDREDCHLPAGIRTLFGNGDGTFQAPRTFAGPGHPGATVLADLIAMGDGT